MKLLLIALLLLGCRAHSEPTATEASTIAEASTTPTSATPTSATPSASTSPTALYEQCKSRLERPESANECTADTDCGRSGCSQEVCTTKAKASEVMTSCEVLPCFGVLSSCGCHEGRCTWTLKDSVGNPFGQAMPALQ